MISNTPGQEFFCNVNSVGNNRNLSPYALLTRMAELDVELAKQASAVGIAADLLFPDDPSAFVTVAPYVVAQKPTP